MFPSFSGKNPLPYVAAFTVRGLGVFPFHCHLAIPSPSQLATTPLACKSSRSWTPRFQRGKGGVHSRPSLIDSTGLGEKRRGFCLTFFFGGAVFFSVCFLVGLLFLCFPVCVFFVLFFWVVPEIIKETNKHCPDGKGLNICILCTDEYIYIYSMYLVE